MAENPNLTNMVIRGFFYEEATENAAHEANGIDQSMAFDDVLSYGGVATDVSYRQVLNKMDSPVLISSVTSGSVNKNKEGIASRLLANNDPLIERTPWSLTVADPTGTAGGDYSNAWYKIFNLISDVMHCVNGARTKPTEIDLDNWLRGSSGESGPNGTGSPPVIQHDRADEVYGSHVASVNMVGYIFGSLSYRLSTTQGQNIGFLSFKVQVTTDSSIDLTNRLLSNTFTFEIYFDPAMTKNVVLGKDKITIYYDLKRNKGSDETAEMRNIFNDIGEPFVSNYQSISVRKYSKYNEDGEETADTDAVEDSSYENQIFHVFTKYTDISSLSVDTLPMFPDIFEALKNAIIEKECTTNEGGTGGGIYSLEDLVWRYPQLFASEIRAIWPLYSKYDAVGVNRNENFVSIIMSDSEISEARRQMEYIFNTTYNTVEVFVQNRPWMVYLVGGGTGALSDKNPVQRPVIDESTFTQPLQAKQMNASKFYHYLDKVINYILNSSGNGAIDESTRKEIDFKEDFGGDNRFVSFQYRACTWVVYRGTINNGEQFTIQKV